MGMKKNYAYIVHELAFIKSNENVYKIGHTQNISKRMTAYQGGELVFALDLGSVPSFLFERHILDVFKNKFVKNPLGNERFEGDYLQMEMCMCFEFCTNFLHLAHSPKPQMEDTKESIPKPNLKSNLLPHPTANIDKLVPPSEPEIKDLFNAHVIEPILICGSFVNAILQERERGVHMRVIVEEILRDNKANNRMLKDWCEHHTPNKDIPEQHVLRKEIEKLRDTHNTWTFLMKNIETETPLQEFVRTQIGIDPNSNVTLKEIKERIKESSFWSRISTGHSLKMALCKEWCINHDESTMYRHKFNPANVNEICIPQKYYDGKNHTNVFSNWYLR